jgi:hypothetical protein
LLNRIKPDKCQQFEKLIHEVLWSKAGELPPDEQQVAAHTRVLHPVEMDKDSAYVYVFLMDPVITGADYRFQYYLTKLYGEENRDLQNALFCHSFMLKVKTFLN